MRDARNGVKNVRPGPAGFTMLEAILVVSLLGIVGLAFGYLFSTSQRFMTQSANFTASQNDASFALEHIKRHLTVATAIGVPAAGNNGAALEFTWQRRAQDPVVTSRYELNGTDLRFIPDTAAPGTFEVVAGGISSITFDRQTAGTVSVEVIAASTSGGDTRQMRLQTNISPRGLFQ